MIMLAIVDDRPKVLNLYEILEEYLKHQKEVMTRRVRFDLDKAEARAHILEGLRIALDNIDEICHSSESLSADQKAHNCQQRFADNNSKKIKTDIRTQKDKPQKNKGTVLPNPL